jgi:hypothetical protein
MKKIIASILMLMILVSSAFAYTGSKTINTHAPDGSIMATTNVSYSYYTVSGKNYITSIDRYTSSLQFMNANRWFYGIIWNPFSPCNSSNVTYKYSRDGRKIGFDLTIYGNLTVYAKQGKLSTLGAVGGNLFQVIMTLLRPFARSSAVANYTASTIIFN